MGTKPSHVSFSRAAQLEDSSTHFNNCPLLQLLQVWMASGWRWASHHQPALMITILHSPKPQELSHSAAASGGDPCIVRDHDQRDWLFRSLLVSWASPQTMAHLSNYRSQMWYPACLSGFGHLLGLRHPFFGASHNSLCLFTAMTHSGHQRSEALQEMSALLSGKELSSDSCTVLQYWGHNLYNRR